MSTGVASSRGHRARFALTIRSALSPVRTMDLLLDPGAHATIVPLTTLVEEETRLAEGDTFTMRTRLGPVVLDDPMVLDRLLRTPTGGAVRFVKTGPVLGGAMLARVRPDAEAGSVLRWDADLAVRSLPRALNPVIGVVAHAGYGAALRRLLS